MATPKNVRNFWATMKVDGKASIATGPLSKEDGMSITLHQRDLGEVVESVVTVYCFVRQDGSLYTQVTVKGHDPIEYITQR